jgi:hypothetical protein
MAPAHRAAPELGENASVARARRAVKPQAAARLAGLRATVRSIYH